MMGGEEAGIHGIIVASQTVKENQKMTKYVVGIALLVSLHIWAKELSLWYTALPD
jgi:hypothetical protein